MRLAAGDAGTLAALYDQHAGAMYSLAMRIAGEPRDAEAIVKGVFATAWSEAGRSTGGPAPHVQWLLATTRIRAIDHIRGGGVSSKVTAPAPKGSAGEVPSGSAPGDVATLRLPDPVQRGTDEQGPGDVPRLRSAFRELPPLERLAIELAYFEGLTISEIARRLEQSPEAANMRIRTGLQRLAGSAGAQPPANEPRHDMPPTREMASLYALGALNARERAAFDAHLEVHRESVDEVLSLLPVTRRLAWTVSPHEPPRELRERIIETVTGAPLPGAVEPEASESSRPPQIDVPAEPTAKDGSEPTDDGSSMASDTSDGAGKASPVEEAAWPASTPKASPVDEEAAWPASTPPIQEPSAPAQQITPTAEKASPAMPTPTSTAQQKGGSRALLLLVAGSLVVAAALGLVAVRQNRLATALQENLDAANTQARIAELETAAARRIAGELREGARVLTADDVQPLELAGQPSAPDARGRLFWTASEGALLAATGLPPLPPGRIYQLWLIPEATPISVALLSVDAEGRAMATVTPLEGVTESVPAAVTLEPAGGAESPGGDVYLLGRP